ncbi:MAG: hypothetical protein JNM02_05360 [Anaerolineales bacterium]|nr:hypothetical protein [Anaerolineales bacterium]
MAEQDRNQLQLAEKFLREGKKREARSFLAGYLQQHPDSTHGWWLLSFAVPDLKQQIDCVERVLRIDPNSALAQARLDKLRENSSDLPPPVPPFVEKISFDEPEEVPSIQPQKQDSKPIAAQAPVPVLKKKNRAWQYVILIVIACILLVVIGIAVVMLIQNDRPTGSATAMSITQISMPPTWTPPPTTTRSPSLTPYPTITPVILPTSDVTPTSIATDSIGLLNGLDYWTLNNEVKGILDLQ